MSQERKKIEVEISEDDDPESKLKAELGRLSEDESKEALQLKVNAENCGGIDQVDRIAKALVRLSKPHWRLVLWIGSNGLESVPESVWELANLEELRLNNNKLKTLSPAIAKLTKLRRLWIGWNPFEGFPEAVCKLEQLEVLFVGGCQLSVLPSSFASLRNLLELYLGSNAFEQFPEVICELRSLRKLWLNGNKLSSLPQSFANLRELRELNISNNRFKEFPQVVCELPNLESLYIWEQPIERAASGHHQACSLEIPEFEWKLVHQLSSVCWRFASAFSLLLIWLVQSARFHFSFSCSQLVQAILFRVPKEASQMPICSDSSNSVERLLDCLPSLEEASAVRSRTRGLDFWFEDCTILDCSSSFSTLPLTCPFWSLVECRGRLEEAD
ncbi:MAG: leucine-rich repeat domain-containing protein [Saprospiraceae bacterium]|nr:leucine-rich repeat domain-containing protein [Candidatus Vicinibacter affinis]